MPRVARAVLLSFLSLPAEMPAREAAAGPHAQRGAGDAVGASRAIPSAPAAAPAPQAAPVVLAPPDGASLHGAGARFAWEPGAGPHYRLQVARDAAFTDLVVDREVLDAGEAIVALPPGGYHWRIAGLWPAERAPARAAPYTDARHFTLRPIPPSPGPEPPRLQAGALTLRWQAGQPGETYQAEVARDPTFGSIVARHAGPDAQMLLPRPTSGTLYLRVRTIDVTGYAGPYGPAQAIDVPRSLWWRLLPPLSVLWWLLLI